jgi:hypothetical protein
LFNQLERRFTAGLTVTRSNQEGGTHFFIQREKIGDILEGVIVVVDDNGWDVQHIHFLVVLVVK